MEKRAVGKRAYAGSCQAKGSIGGRRQYRVAVPVDPDSSDWVSMESFALMFRDIVAALVSAALDETEQPASGWRWCSSRQAAAQGAPFAAACK